MKTIHQQIEKERDAARQACSTDASSAECAVAWDTVEELQAEAAHQQEAQPKKSPLEQYCDANPDADECRIYED